ncbi:uncharacterized protein LOC135713496 [Ochlerotatus camptorhynchus]|uniref:uncharacterized protein LOC135713496 n=1 Tax=Ochlerotatus camptorhynchus TaxID=644619 RepID=UPI0031DC7276
MEENVISMFMDVKLDIRERKLEYSHLKSWTRYFVRVEAVKCFPCYIKISFFKSHTDESTDLIVRINIPGLTVQMATSRTRAHSYGLFWKNNRKRCCAYFALPSQLLCERHLRWMKKSIRNLELYRQEILQLRRASRTPIHEIRNEIQPSTSNNDMGLYQNLDFTQNMADVHDILGPLPNLPDQSQVSMARRISGISGIYEEILDPNKPIAALSNGSRLSRASIASGIYEEMKLADIKEQAERSFGTMAEADDVIAPPPLPPRPRSHTNDFELQRSFTTPESDYLKKKKHWLLFESMFGRRRTNSGSASTGGDDHKQPKADNVSTKKTATSEPNQKVVYRDKVAHLRFAENKRNSFSSPDLSALKVDGISGNGSTDNISNGGSCSSEFYVLQEGDFIEENCLASSESLNVSKCSSIEESLANLMIADEERDRQGMNVSENIIDNFNILSNTSTVNLAGWNCVMSVKENPPAIGNPEGYCEMGAPGTGFDRQKLQCVELRTRSASETCNDESIYMNMDGGGTVKEDASRSSSTSSGVSSIYSNRSSVCSSSNKHRNSIDDKIASYYPNEDFRSPKKTEPAYTPTVSPNSREGSVKRTNSKRSENHHTTSPKTTHRKASPQNISTIPRMSKSGQKPSCSKSRVNTRSVSSERGHSSHPIIMITDGSPTKNSENNPPETIPRLYKKYATVARGVSISPSKYQEKNSSRKGGEPQPAGNGKRFGSLPRFAKIDLSPLRLKINSVLQRHNQENL